MGDPVYASYDTHRGLLMICKIIYAEKFLKDSKIILYILL